jgi:hypothetical protein
MHREENELTGVCVVCGEPTDVTTERAFGYGEDGLVCWACAIDRGGVYDEDRQAWVKPPDLAGLPDASRPHP